MICFHVHAFQYITCYSLSKNEDIYTDSEQRFNTSHVTLYQYEEAENVINGYEFQYITCYSLSSEFELKQIGDWCFNTSHVTLYLFHVHIAGNT